MIKWTYKNKEYTSDIETHCQFCKEFAVIRLPPDIIAEQPDDTTHVCLPAAGGCSHGFSDKPESKPKRKPRRTAK